MRIETLGDGEPEVAIVGGIHGDEPCGPAAVDHLVAERPPVDRPVALVIANERALEQGVRYVDEDLNRAFPGDTEAETHEGRLAAGLTSALSDCETLSLHSTQSYGDPFAIVDEVDDFARRVVPGLSVDVLVEAGDFDGGRIFETVSSVVEVECGLQRSVEAAEAARRIAEEFLVAVDALDPGSIERDQQMAGDQGLDRDPIPVFRLHDRVPKDPAESYEVHVANFEPVEAGEAFASADGEVHRAVDSFYPVLMSAEGYEDVFGYAASLAGELT